MKKHMRICIDISQIVYGTGVSTYTKNLVENLLKIDKENEYLLYAGALRRKNDVLSAFPQAKVFPVPPALANLLWNRLHLLPIEKLVGEVDIFHTSDWAEPPAKARKVTTVHDLYPLKFPKLIDPVVREVHKKKLGWVFKETKKIIVPSESTKSDLLELGINGDRIVVIPEASSLSRSSDDSIKAVKAKYGLKGDYLISIGATILKNTDNIIKAFHLAKGSMDVKLVIVGRPVGLNLQEDRNIRSLGYVSQDDLAALLSGSRGLVFASLYEGFGIPILDAFNCGVPVVTSNVASMPEVAGNAAALVDPYDISSITDGIEKILKGPKAFIEKGTRRVKDFSWEETAKKTLNVYKELGGLN